jgi:preprotein translocase subunit SecF
MLVGIISGTYSTVFIASATAILLQGRKPLKGQPAAASPSATRPSKRRAS